MCTQVKLNQTPRWLKNWSGCCHWCGDNKVLIENLALFQLLVREMWWGCLYVWWICVGRFFFICLLFMSIWFNFFYINGTNTSIWLICKSCSQAKNIKKKEIDYSRVCFVETQDSWSYTVSCPHSTKIKYIRSMYITFRVHNKLWKVVLCIHIGFENSLNNISTIVFTMICSLIIVIMLKELTF